MAIPKDHERVMDSYFSTFSAIQKGDEGAVDRMMELWSDDGRCQVVGAGAFPDEYRGRNAIRSLYKGIAQSPARDVQTEKGQMRSTATEVIVEWTSQVAAGANRLEVGGSNQFQFKDDKISSLKIVLSPKGAAGRKLKLHELAVNDVGRLALAAWAVV